MLETLKDYEQWVCWATINDRKVPIDPKTGQAASTTAKTTWASYHEALEMQEQNPGQYGLGFVFTRNDPFFGVDVDKCIGPEGFNEVAESVINRLGESTYGEFSPSGTGLHFIGIGSIPQGVKNKDDHLGLEVYSQKRFFTMTFNQMENCQDDVGDAQDGLTLVCNTWLSKKAKKSDSPLSQGDKIPVFQEGERDEKLFQVATSCYHRGLSKWQAYAIIDQLAENCHPQFDKETACRKVDSAWKSEDPHPGDILEQMNKLYAVVATSGTVTIAALPPEHGHPLRFYSTSNLRTLMANQWVRWEDSDGKLKKDNWLDFWLKSPERNTYENMVFRPRKEVKSSFLNLWRGFAVEPRKDDKAVEPFLEHLWKHVAGEDEECYHYIIGWLTSLVRHPDTGPMTALVFRGFQGSGKGIIGQYMSRIFGSHFITASQPEHFVGRFNAHLADKALLFADEAIWGGDKRAEGELKHMITDPQRTVEIKGKDAFEIENKLHMMIASNEDWVVPVGPNDRRFAIFDMVSREDWNPTIVGKMWSNLDTGGPEALLYFLEHEAEMPGNKRMPNPPNTKAKTEQKFRGMDPFLKVWSDWMVSKNMAGRGWERILPAESLFQDYVERVKELRGGRGPMIGQSDFTNRLKKVFGDRNVATKRATWKQVRELKERVCDVAGVAERDEEVSTTSVGQFRIVILSDYDTMRKAFADSMGVDPEELRDADVEMREDIEGLLEYE